MSKYNNGSHCCFCCCCYLLFCCCIILAFILYPVLGKAKKKRFLLQFCIIVRGFRGLSSELGRWIVGPQVFVRCPGLRIQDSGPRILLYIGDVDGVSVSPYLCITCRGMWRLDDFFGIRVTISTKLHIKVNVT